jgi:hypothetical protein
MLQACGGGGSGTDVVAPLLRTYGSTHINANWSGGATGNPISTKSVVPTDNTASNCPPNSIDLQNHGTKYQNILGNITTTQLVLANNCTSPVTLLACVSAGSGSGVNTLPVCNTDPRTTPASRLQVFELAAAGNGIRSLGLVNSPNNIDVNVFYCGVGDTFTLGVVAGAQPTDCLAR